MKDNYVAYVGTYTHESSKGIHIYDMDVEKGRICEREEVSIDNPSYITLHTIRDFFMQYAIREYHPIPLWRMEALSL